jgi:signal transduction histidine kinase/CheY-like chemotaxis protein
MRNAIEGLFERYRAHHDMGSPLLQWIGLVGFFAFPLFYLLRSTSALPPLYDDLPLRAAASVLCLGLALRRFWPRRLRVFYLVYSYGTVFYSLAFLLSFTMLKNQGGTPSVVNMVMAAIIVILLADWRNAVVILVFGYLASVAAYVATDPAPHIPPEFVISAAGSILVVVAGALSHYGQKRSELERMRRAYASIAGSIAHEVRTPLAQVQFSLETVGARMPSDSELAEAVAQGQNAVRRGLQAIELTLHHLKESAIDTAAWQEISATECVRKAVGEFAYEVPSQRERVSVQANGDFLFRGSETTLILILFNLLKNALYYLPLSPHARVTLRVEAQPAHRIVVRDTGPGIDPQHVSHLFEDFQTRGKAEGTGIGLAFCRRAMRALGGDIACESRPGSFTEFHLTFPAIQESAATALASTTQPNSTPPADRESHLPRRPLTGRRVLVVDDSPLNRKIARSRLVALGADVIEATHAAEALRSLREGAHADAILMDMNMPGMSGIEATLALRALPGPTARTPVILVTADPTGRARQSAFDVGVDAFIVKPLESHLLQAELVRLLGPHAGGASVSEHGAQRLAALG